jgi:hypothetical protein
LKIKLNKIWFRQKKISAYVCNWKIKQINVFEEKILMQFCPFYEYWGK